MFFLSHTILTLKRRLRKSQKLYDFLGLFYGAKWNILMRLARGLRGYDDNAVVFSSFDYRSYNDNPRYISEALHALRPETKIIWLFKDVKSALRRYDVPDYVRPLRHASVAGICAMARARVVVDNFNKKFYLKFPGRDQVYVQTWHGDRAFKKVGYDNPAFNFRMLEEHASICVTGSEYGDMQARSAFHYKGELMRVGYPRNDILVRNDPAERAAIRAKLGLDDDVCALLHAPTYRDSERQTNRQSGVHMDLLHVLDALEARTGKKWKCLIRAHYMSLGLSLDASSDRLISVNDYPEMGELLLAADALLTDYSSCAGDFALCRRPIYLYMDDLNDYVAKSRKLYFDVKDSPYWIATTPEELDALIEQTTPEGARANCDEILRFYGEAETGHAARSVAEYIASKLEAFGRKHA